MSKMVSLRLPDDLAEWAEGYAKQREVSRSDLLVEGLRCFKEDCEAGVPEIRAAISRQSGRNARLTALQGVGNCPERPGELGHVWTSPQENPERPCVHCGLLGRLSRPVGQVVEERPNHLDMATRERAEVFSGMAAPMQSGSGSVEKAHPKGLPPAMAAHAARIVEDKKRRDAEAVANGTARPGQVAGAPKGPRS